MASLSQSSPLGDATGGLLQMVMVDLLFKTYLNVDGVQKTETGTF